MKVITIRVEGGMVQEVEDVPAGVTVRLLDYDTPKVEKCDTRDGAGTPCVIELHEGEGLDEVRDLLLEACEMLLIRLEGCGPEVPRGYVYDFAKSAIAKAKEGK